MINVNRLPLEVVTSYRQKTVEKLRSRNYDDTREWLDVSMTPHEFIITPTKPEETRDSRESREENQRLE